MAASENCIYLKVFTVAKFTRQEKPHKELKKRLKIAWEVITVI